ncbi:hypothetical protein VM932_07290, partial [Muricauda sp. SYSU M86414]|nr:hypothetical protein [Muricauda sp. SYSU M86414]
MKHLFMAMGAALLSSFCCITPVLALVAGTSGLASTFSWLDPIRPYFGIKTNCCVYAKIVVNLNRKNSTFLTP